MCQQEKESDIYETSMSRNTYQPHVTPPRGGQTAGALSGRQQVLTDTGVHSTSPVRHDWPHFLVAGGNDDDTPDTIV